MARLFCGPDRSTWVSESYETPSRTLATFMESLRRADRQTLLRCLSEPLKAREGGIGTLGIEVIWDRLSKQTVGIHLLGTANVEGPTHLDEGRVAYILRVSGHALRVELLRQTYWECRWTDASDPEDVYADGAFASPDAQLRTDADGKIRIDVSMTPTDAPPSLGAITFAGMGSAWKVDAIEPLEGDPTAPSRPADR